MLKRPVHVLGAGGIGVALAWALLRKGSDVTLIDDDPAKVGSGRQAGLTIEGRETFHPPFVAFDEWTPPPDAHILLCTKTFDNPAALARIGDIARLVPVQNGFDPLLEGRGHPLEGIASFVSECDRHAPVSRITRPGDLHIGARRRIDEREREELQALAGAFDAGGLFTVRLVDDVRPYKAAKLMYNAAISPLAAATGVDNGELLTDPLGQRLFFALLQENYAILRHAGVPLARIGPFHPDTVSRILRTPTLPSIMAVFFRPSLKGTYCSMAPDIATGRTEVEAYNGHLIRLAGEMPCPLNRAARATIVDIMSGAIRQGRENFARIAQALPGAGRR